jgi:hypothetical protein
MKKKSLITKSIGIAALLVSLLILPSVLFSQNRFSYDYDANGNRIQREVIVLSGSGKSMISSTDSIREQTELSIIHKDEISIYPNPTKGHLKVEINSQTAVGNVSIDVYNMRGQNIYRKTDLSTFYDIDLSNATNGAYILVIRINESKYEWKIIKD